jgi:hypothetical protein
MLVLRVPGKEEKCSGDVNVFKEIVLKVPQV